MTFNGRIGVLAEVACETDVVARNDEFVQFGADLCLHIAAMNPRYLEASDVDEAAANREREILIEQTRTQMAGKPDEVVAKAVEGRMKKFFSEHCLMDQAWVKDDKQSVEDVRKALVGRIGENIQVRRFQRLQLGE